MPRGRLNRSRSSSNDIVIPSVFVVPGDSARLFLYVTGALQLAHLPSRLEQLAEFELSNGRRDSPEKEVHRWQVRNRERQAPPAESICDKGKTQNHKNHACVVSRKPVCDQPGGEVERSPDGLENGWENYCAYDDEGGGLAMRFRRPKTRHSRFQVLAARCSFQVLPCFVRCSNRTKHGARRTQNVRARA